MTSGEPPKGAPGEPPESEETSGDLGEPQPPLTPAMGRAFDWEKLFPDPQEVGPYRILEVLGEGGMGVVYRAEQTVPLRRQVALKLIKPGMDSREVVARFEAERQALALMNHPSIARVYEAGVTEDGRPYFVMEYVAGEPITSYCDRHHLSTRERLELFIPLCQAVQHAHQKAIIHRDLKPSNVLVMIQDSKPIPKVIDFGIAKALNQRLTEKTYFTERGVIIGTPEYMSPEQAEMGALDIDTRTDVYSLGAILYEILVGELPFDRAELRAAGYREIQRIIRETEPVRPSTRLNGLGKDAGQLARNRGTDLRRLADQVRGDLDWITMKALEKDRSRRYGSAGDLAEDIARHLSLRPVLAGPPGPAYQIAKFARRHRGPVAAFLAVLASLIAGLIASVCLYLKSESSAAEAVLNETRAVRLSYVANVQAADYNIRLGRIEDARASLEACDRALRGWEWDHVSLKLASSLRSFSGGRPYRCAAAQRRGGMVAAGTEDGDVELWAIDSGQRLAVLAGHQGAITAVAFSPDGSSLATGGRDGQLKVWDLATRSGRNARAAHAGGVDSISWKDPRIGLLSGGADARLKRWDPAGGASSADLEAPGRVLAVAAGGDPAIVVAGTDGGAVIEWRWDGKAFEVLRIQNAHRRAATCVDLSPEADRGASGGDDGLVRVWTVGSAEFEVLAEHRQAVTGVRFDPQGALLATASKDRTIRIWRLREFWETDARRAPSSVRSRHPSFALQGHDEEVNSVDFAEGSMLLSASGGSLRIWDAGSPPGTTTSQLPSRAGFSISVDPRGRNVALPGGRDGLVLWDPVTGASRSLAPPGVMMFAVAHDREGRRLWAAATEGTLHAFDPATGREELMLHDPQGAMSAFAASLDGAYLATASIAGGITIWNAEAGRPTLAIRGSGSGIAGLCFSPDSKRLASVDAQGAARIWKIPGGEPASSFSITGEDGRPETTATCLAWSPDGRRLAIGGGVLSLFTKGASFLGLWDAESGNPVAHLKGHREMVLQAVFSPDGARLLTSSVDTSLRIWEMLTGRCLLVLEDIPRNPNHATVAWSLDGRRIIGAVNKWVIEWESEVSWEKFRQRRGAEWR